MHRTDECSEFRSLSVPNRLKIAREKGLCFRCLNRGHLGSMSKTSNRCGTDGCGRDHHSLLHVADFKGPGNTAAGSCLATTHETELVPLGVLPVRVRGPQGTETVYALLDSGSDISLIE